MRRQSNVTKEWALPLPEVSWVGAAECLLIFVEAQAPMWAEGNKCEDAVLPLKAIEDLLAVNVEVEDDWDLQLILSRNAIDLRSGLPGDF